MQTHLHRKDSWRVWSFVVLLAWLHCCFHKMQGEGDIEPWSHGENSCSGTSSLSPVGEHRVPFVVPMVQEAGWQTLLPWCRMPSHRPLFAAGWTLTMGDLRMAGLAAATRWWVTDWGFLSLGWGCRVSQLLVAYLTGAKHLMGINLPVWGWDFFSSNAFVKQLLWAALRTYWLKWGPCTRWQTSLMPAI